MRSKGFIKRMLPFLATFAVGIFVASFFVNISAPSFRGRGTNRRHHEMKRLRVENEELRNENLRLKNEMESIRWNSPHISHFEWNNPGVEFPVPLPPPPPAAPRAKR